MLNSPTLCFLETSVRRGWRRTRRDERGEGVVSVAIAVLIMAFLGALMYVGFSGTMKNAQSKTDCNVSSLGLDASAAGSGC